MINHTVSAVDLLDVRIVPKKIFKYYFKDFKASLEIFSKKPLEGRFFSKDRSNLTKNIFIKEDPNRSVG